MFPSEQRLLQSARHALRHVLAGGAGVGDGGTALAGVNLALDELLRRTDAPWLTTHIAEAEALIEAGNGLRALDPPRTDAAVPTTADPVSSKIAALQTALSQLVVDLAPRESGNASIKSYLTRVVDWENQLYARRAPGAEPVEPLPTPAVAFTVEALSRYFGVRFPDWREVSVSNLRLVGGGFSKITVMIDVEAQHVPRRTLVIRAETADSLLFYDSAKIDNEFQVLRLLHRGGTNVAEPLWLESDASHFGARFLVSARATGKNFGSAIRVNECLSETVLRDLMANVYTIHQTRIEATDECVRDSHLAHWLRYQTLTESTAQHMAYWKNNVALLGLPPSPIIARALAWLTSHIPASDEAPCLIHRDYGLHNLLVENDRISCVLDWENATLGDPAEDLAWIINGLAGSVDRQILIDLYGELRGRPVPAERLRFFEVFNCLKYAVTCLHALTLFERNRNAPLSLCEVGLLFMHHGTKRLNESIALAEQTIVGRPTRRTN